MQEIKRLKKRGLVLMGLALVTTVFLLVFLLDLWGGTTQPLAFNHKIHAENDVACQDCHIYFMDHASSGRPTLETCAMCHEEPLTDNKEEKKLVEFIQAGEEIEWERLYRVAEDVYFSHRMHVALGEIECAACHGDIGQSERPPSRPQKITMKKCMVCHEDKQVDNDCIACHR